VKLSNACHLDTVLVLLVVLLTTLADAADSDKKKLANAKPQKIESDMVLIKAGEYNVDFVEGENPGGIDLRLFYACDRPSLFYPTGGKRSFFTSLYGGKGVINIPTSFYIDKYEVTNARYKVFVETTRHRPPGYWFGLEYPEGTGNHPVLVNLEDAKAYAEWAGKRLPTYDELTAAAADPATRTSPWTGKIDPKDASKYRMYSSLDADLLNTVDEVGGCVLDRSPSGVYDLIGNALEWTVTPTTFEDKQYLKLGSYSYTKSDRKPVMVHMTTAESCLGYGIILGFRCVKDVSPAQSPKTIPGKASKPAKSPFPAFTISLSGSNQIWVTNPNDFTVQVGIRDGEKGIDFGIPAYSSSVAYVPNGKYEIYFLYSNRPGAVFKGDDFSVNNNGLEIKIVKVVDGNFGIRQVK
jgi:formylglycine-generating enzyme required for sulfatase activity